MKNFDEIPQYINVSGLSLEKVSPQCGYWVKSSAFEELLSEYKKVCKEKLEFSLSILKGFEK